MAVSNKVYGKALLSLAAGLIKFTTDDIRCALVANSYVPDQDVHQFWSDVTGELATGSGYTVNGVALTSKVSTYTGATNVMMLDCDDPTWNPATLSARWAVVYDRTPAGATPAATGMPLICFIDLSADNGATLPSSSNGPFSVQINTAGLVTLTAA